MITFIVGTDTDAGKTFYGKKMAREGMKVIKPIETGKTSFVDINESDSYQYSTIQGKAMEDINLYFFNEPVSPHLASELDEAEVSLEAIKTFINNQSPCMVELAGGLMVPITRGYTQLDLIKDTPNAKVDLVVGNKLGCINHALMTIKILKESDIKINRIYINDFGKEKTPMMIDNEKVIMDFLNTK